MKAARFDYVRARDAAHAASLLGDPHAKAIAGGQSLGPMLNLRLARPSLLVDVSACEDLRGYVDEGDAIVYGAAITHAEIEDGRVPDALDGHMAAAARRIAYRAVRNRGTIGGSIAHADPAADWPTILLATGAEVIIQGPSGLRALALADFVTGPFSTALAADDVLVGVRVAKRGAGLRWGYRKVSVKVGEFAHAFVVAMHDPASGERRAVVGAIERVPLVVDDPDPGLGDLAGAAAMLSERLPFLTATRRHAHAATLSRVVRELDAPGGGGMKQDLRLTVNGTALEARVEPRTHLADYLRESRNLTGTHLGCEHGVCGACTVELDGVPVRGCITFAAACDGARVRTIEGYDGDPVMQALRAAFSRHHALQCGYCTPGMLITARDIVLRLPDASESRIREELSGNLCRCTGYAGIVAAIRDVLSAAPGAGAGPLPPTREPARRAATLPRAAPRDAAAAAPEAAPDSTHRVVLEAPPAQVWRVLRDPAMAVRCMPGAELTSTPDASPLAYRMTAAVGPMRATFEGLATLHYDDDALRGAIEGEGLDARSRSSARGRVDFAVAPSGSGSELLVTLDYTISGPLAQFSRGAVVDAVVEQLVARFAANVAAAAAGEAVSDAPAGGLGLLVSALRQRIRRWLGF